MTSHNVSITGDSNDMNLVLESTSGYITSSGAQPSTSGSTVVFSGDISLSLPTKQTLGLFEESTYYNLVNNPGNSYGAVIRIARNVPQKDGAFNSALRYWGSNTVRADLANYRGRIYTVSFTKNFLGYEYGKCYWGMTPLREDQYSTAYNSKSLKTPIELSNNLMRNMWYWNYERGVQPKGWNPNWTRRFPPNGPHMYDFISQETVNTITGIANPTPDDSSLKWPDNGPGALHVNAQTYSTIRSEMINARQRLDPLNYYVDSLVVDGYDASAHMACYGSGTRVYKRVNYVDVLTGEIQLLNQNETTNAHLNNTILYDCSIINQFETKFNTLLTELNPDLSGDISMGLVDPSFTDLLDLSFGNSLVKPTGPFDSGLLDPVEKNSVCIGTLKTHFNYLIKVLVDVSSAKLHGATDLCFNQPLLDFEVTPMLNVENTTFLMKRFNELITQLETSDISASVSTTAIVKPTYTIDVESNIANALIANSTFIGEDSPSFSNTLYPVTLNGKGPLPTESMVSYGHDGTVKFIEPDFEDILDLGNDLLGNLA